MTALFALLYSPSLAQSEAEDCAVARRYGALADAYSLLLRSSGDPNKPKVAFYAGILIRSVSAGAPPNVRSALLELQQLADLVQASGGLTTIGEDARARHLENARVIADLGSVSGCVEFDRSAAFEEREDSPPAPAESDSAQQEPKDRPGIPSGNSAPGNTDAATLIQNLGREFTRDRILIALGLLTMVAVGWLLRLIALELQMKLPRFTPRLSRMNAISSVLGVLAKNRRKAPHHVLGRFFDVTENGSGERKRMKVADISVTGAKLAWTGAPKAGTRLHLNLDGIGKQAKIVWVNPHFCGLSFDSPLAEAELKMILARPAEQPDLSGELEMF
ncbi:MAG: hypothetical protein AAF566_03015 [Pseudomonadota bacterium]